MAVRPHAVSQTVTTGSTAATRSYEYDAAGGRVIRQESGKTTLTVAGTELTVDNATGTATASRYYAHAGQAVAVRTGNTNAELFSLINDHQGTAHNQIRNSDSQLQSIWQDPYGNKRGTAPAAWAGGRGFVGGLNDVSTGLVRLGARDFDPVLQRFTTVDPVQVLDVPLQWNPYLYGDNSPVTKADPSGLCWICGIGNAIAGAARAVVGVVKATVTKVASAVKRVATAVVKKVASVAAKVVHEAVKVAKKIARAVTTAVRTVKAAVKHTVKRVVSKAKHVASSAGKSVDHAKKAVSEGVKRAGDTLNEYGDAIQLGLDVVGLVPVVGEIADGANAIIYAAKGDYANAALSAAAMIPIGGQAATGLKLGLKGLNAATDLAKNQSRVIKRLESLPCNWRWTICWSARTAHSCGSPPWTIRPGSTPCTTSPSTESTPTTPSPATPTNPSSSTTAAGCSCMRRRAFVPLAASHIGLSSQPNRSSAHSSRERMNCWLSIKEVRSSTETLDLLS